MNESAKDSATAVAADMLEREFQFSAEYAERIARRVMSVLLPPLEAEVDKINSERKSVLLETKHEKDQFHHVMDRFAQTIDSMLQYARSIGNRPGHYVDVPLDDRTAYELEGLLRDWQRIGGQRYRPSGGYPDGPYNIRMEEYAARGRLTTFDEAQRQRFAPEFTLEEVVKAADSIKAATINDRAAKQIERQVADGKVYPRRTRRPPEA
jgi:hypothetical protein